MSPTVGSIWARATRTGAGAAVTPKYRRRGGRSGPRRSLGLRRCGPPSPPGRFLGGGDAADRRRARRRGAGSGAGRAVPSLASASQKPFIVPQPRPTEAANGPPTTPTPTATPTRSRRRRNRRTAAATSASTGWPRASTPPSLDDGDGNGVPDFVEQVLKIAEHVHEVENEKLGWREPKSDGRIGGGRGKTDIYLSQIGGELFGYAAPDRGQTSKQHRIPRRLHGYLVLDNDYSPFEFPGTKPLEDLEVTLAHEYNHILQFGYDAYQDPWFAESTATWMEDQVYNGINDYLRYVRRWVKRYDTPLTTSSIKEYGSAVWNQWLQRRYGARRSSATPGRGRSTSGPAASRSAPTNARSAPPATPTSSHDFARFAADVAEWRTGEGFRESGLFPDMPRQGSLPARRRHADPPAQPHHLPALAGPRPGGRAAVVHLTAPRGTSPPSP